jgi:hypothetical protein
MPTDARRRRIRKRRARAKLARWNRSRYRAWVMWAVERFGRRQYPGAKNVRVRFDSAGHPWASVELPGEFVGLSCQLNYVLTDGGAP